MSYSLIKRIFQYIFNGPAYHLPPLEVGI